MKDFMVKLRGRLSRLTTPSSATAECGAAPAWWAERRRRKQVPLALLGICSRTIVAQFPTISVYRRIWKGVSTHPQTLGEHLRLARIDRKMTNVQVARILGVAYQTVEKWEHNRHPIGKKHRPAVIAFLGYEPASPSANPTGDFSEA